eukprot:9983713-Karenia_brevis.AAC.1
MHERTAWNDSTKLTPRSQHAEETAKYLEQRGDRLHEDEIPSESTPIRADNQLFYVHPENIEDLVHKGDIETDE